MLENIENLKITPGTRILIRSALNVPIANNKVIDNTRIYQSSRTLKLLKEKGAKIVVISHIGRTGGSLLTVSEELQKFIPHKFIGDILGDNAKNAVNNLNNGDIVVLENIRQDSREKAKSHEFAEELAKYGDLFVLDAFADAHRDHSSISLLPHILPSYLGIRFMEEVKTLKRFVSPDTPSVCVIGGAKLETKVDLLIKLLENYTKVLVGGVLANTLLANRGFEVGESVVEELQKNLPHYEYLVKHPNICLPVDVVVKRDDNILNVEIEEIAVNDKIVDIGVKTIKNIETDIKNAKSILWNGPLGWYEEGFTEQSITLANMIAESDAYSVVGGGDTTFILKKIQIENKISFVSTGGGAMLDFLANGGRFKYLDIV